jgi:hypothetical protein
MPLARAKISSGLREALTHDWLLTQKSLCSISVDGNLGREEAHPTYQQPNHEASMSSYEANLFVTVGNGLSRRLRSVAVQRRSDVNGCAQWAFGDWTAEMRKGGSAATGRAPVRR